MITTDASNEALGAVLSQIIQGEDRPVAFASRTLKDAEKNYSTTEKELLAIVWGVKHFRPYLLSKEFIVYTDHKPLQGVLKSQDPSSRILRLQNKLSEFQYKVVYKSGKSNTNADALSRIPQVINVSSMPKWSFDSSNGIKIPRGIVNKGNECFAISLVQALFHTPPVKRYVLHVGQSKGQLFTSMRHLFQVLECGGDAMDDFVDDAAWEDLGKMYPAMFTGNQEDPHELLQLWLEWLTQEGDEGELPMEKLCLGEQFSQRICTRCQNELCVTEEFGEINIEPSNEHVQDILEDV